jgi:hypothetical protein
MKHAIAAAMIPFVGAGFWWLAAFIAKQFNKIIPDSVLKRFLFNKI